MDLHDVAELLTPTAPHLRFRMGAVSAIAADGTLSVTIAGSSTVVAGVKALASVCPKVGAGVWLATDGLDLFAIGTIAPVGPALCSVRRTTDQSVATGANVAVDFGAAASVIDTHGMFSTAASDRLTVRVPGFYRVQITLEWAGNATGYRRGLIYRNSDIVGHTLLDMAGATVSRFPVVADAVLCAAGDVLKAEVRHTAGVALALVSAADYSPRLTAVWLRPVSP